MGGATNVGREKVGGKESSGGKEKGQQTFTIQLLMHIRIFTLEPFPTFLRRAAELAVLRRAMRISLVVLSSRLLWLWWGSEESVPLGVGCRLYYILVVGQGKILEIVDGLTSTVDDLPGLWFC